MRRGPAGQPLSAEYIFSCVSAELPVVLEVSNYREAVDDVEMSLRNGHIPGLGLPRLRSQAAVAGNEMYCTILLFSSPPWEAPPSPTIYTISELRLSPEYLASIISSEEDYIDIDIRSTFASFQFAS